MIGFALLGASAWATPVPPEEAQNDCVLEIDEMEPVLKGGAVAHRPTRSDPRRTETIPLEDGVVLSYSVSGCVRSSYAFAWAPLRSTQPTNDPGWPKRAIDLLHAAQPKVTDPHALQILARSLSAPGASVAKLPLLGHEWRLPCGEAACSMKVREVEGGRELSVAYSVPM